MEAGNHGFALGDLGMASQLRFPRLCETYTQFSAQGTTPVLLPRLSLYAHLVGGRVCRRRAYYFVLVSSPCIGKVSFFQCCSGFWWTL